MRSRPKGGFFFMYFYPSLVPFPVRPSMAARSKLCFEPSSFVRSVAFGVQEAFFSCVMPSAFST